MFIDGIEVIDSFSFGAGFLFCMFSDVILSLCNFLINKCFEIRERRRFYKSCVMTSEDYKDYKNICDVYMKVKGKEQR